MDVAASSRPQAAILFEDAVNFALRLDNDHLVTHATDEVHTTLRTGVMRTQGSKMIVISTAGRGADSPLGRLRGRALAQPKVKRLAPARTYAARTCASLGGRSPREADPDDTKAVKAGNPASRITAADLAEQREAVPELPFRRFHVNQWVERPGDWLPPGAWQQIAREPELLPGEPIWIGLDVGGDRSTTAVAG